MEFNFSITRVLLLAALVAAFAIVGGFSPPVTAPGSALDPHKVARAWIYIILLFLSGAVCATIVDHFVGLMDRTNIRIVYVILGIALMAGSVLWLHLLRVATHERPPQAHSPARATDNLPLDPIQHPTHHLPQAPALAHLPA